MVESIALLYAPILTSNENLHRIAQVSTKDDETSAIELDSHADSPVVGKHASIIRKTAKQVNVSGFTVRLGSAIPVDVIDAAVVYDCETGNSYLMIIHNALYLEEIKVHLIPPFMMRLSDIEVDECPKFLAKNPNIKNHSVYFRQHDLRLPLQIHAIILYLPVRASNETELLEIEIELEITPNVPNWNPHDQAY